MKELTALLAVLIAAGVSIAGWITNVIWTFQQESLGDIVLGALGVFVPFIGIFHGIYTWF